MPPSKPCGQHTELASNNSVRVTKCTCGTVHITLLASGVTVRMSADALRGTASGLRAALERMDETSALGSTTIN